MSDEFLEETNSKRLVYSAVLAAVIHTGVFIGWNRVSLEQNAYAVGHHAGVVMLIAAPPAVEPAPVQQKASEIVPEKIMPTEFKKKIQIKERKKPAEEKLEEKKIAEQQPASVNATSEVSPDPAARGRFDGAGDGQSNNRAEPDYLNNPSPVYPRESRRNREEGIVLIFAEINAGGRVEALRLKTSSGYSRLDDAAVKAVRDWKFKPARFAGIAIESNVEIPVRFSLN
jgi:protein TonB